ncbi:hypothetical protein RIF29_25252 [Crotalaria pallida]|uniref:Uncharacterized protein n=1 Tax=Crotalaria pallida TaxID=3830 RepID=A0AAN9ENF6_CROPI
MDAHANTHVKNDTKILNQIKKSIRVLRAAADTKKGSNNIPLEHFLGYMWRLSECSHSCNRLVHYYVQSHNQINEYRDRVILPSASKKHRRPITTCVKVLDMTGLKLSALNQIKKRISGCYSFWLTGALSIQESDCKA